MARDLIAQAEHDTDAMPILVTTDASLPARVNAEIEAQLATRIDIAEPDLSLRMESSTDRWRIKQFRSSRDSGHAVIVTDTRAAHGFAPRPDPPLRSLTHSCNTLGSC